MFQVGPHKQTHSGTVSTFSRHLCGEVVLTEVVVTTNGGVQPGQVASLCRLTCLNRNLILALGFLHTCMVKDELEVNEPSLSLKSK